MRNFRLFSIACALLCVLGSADARPGGGSSMGSRGSRTWSAPPRTSITPSWTRPMDRTMTPQSNYGAQSSAPRPMAPMTPGYRPSFPNRHPFMTGFAGGLLGAGLFGILSGHGFFGGMTGGTSILGFLFQVFVIGALIMFAIRLFNRRQGASGSPAAAPFGAASGGNAPVPLSNDDYTSFQRLLLDIQSAWSAQNMRALSSMTTPEMAGYFNEQLSDLASRGARNIVSNVRFLRGDLSEAWRERNLTYATVAMQYSMTDVTTDSFGNVIDGSSTEPVTVTELWTFVRADGRGNWILSAIQQGG